MNHRIENAVNYIKSHFNKQIGVADLALVACLSRSQLDHLFKIAMGMPPSKYIEKLRLEYAYQALLIKPTNVQDLSEQCGYLNYETFSCAFKKVYHLSPDDLAMVVKQIKIDNPENVDIYLTAVDELNHSQLQSLIEEILNNNQWTDSDLESARVIKVEPVNGSKATKRLVKNKFKVAPCDLLDLLVIKMKKE